jgi:DNA-binding NtrC family response regulator
VRVLVVEDDALLSDAIARDTARAGHDVQTAPTVNAAIFALEARPDLVIVDVKLPDGSGIDVARAALERRPAPTVVAISGRASPPEAFTLAQLGVRGYLAKPFELGEFRELIAHVIGRAPSIDPYARAQVGVAHIHTVQDQVKKAMLEQALAECDANFVDVARKLGVTRQAVQQMVERYELKQWARGLRDA